MSHMTWSEKCQKSITYYLNGPYLFRIISADAIIIKILIIIMIFIFIFRKIQWLEKEVMLANF